MTIETNDKPADLGRSYKDVRQEWQDNMDEVLDEVLLNDGLHRCEYDDVLVLTNEGSWYIGFVQQGDIDAGRFSPDKLGIEHVEWWCNNHRHILQERTPHMKVWFQ